MKFDKQDPRITAYALGEELEGTDKAFIEEIQDHEAFITLVDEIRTSASAFASLYELESVAPETVQADEILESYTQAMEKRKILDFPRLTKALLVSSGSIAAVFVLGTIFIPQVAMVKREAERETEIVFEEIPVGIPGEFIEGTPQPVVVEGLETVPTSAPRIVVAREAPVEPRRRPRSEEASILIADSANEIGRVSVSPSPVVSGPSIPVGSTNREESLINLNASRLVSTAAPEMGERVGPNALFFSEPLPQIESFNREGYDRIQENEFQSPLTAPLSTFSIDVDTASYANVRRFIRNGQIPPPDAVRIEELINYFDYDYDAPEKIGDAPPPFSVTTDLVSAPWASQHELVRIGLQGYEIPWSERSASNLVFLIDVSGSMSSANKLGLVKKALIELVQKLDRRDRVAIVTYAGSSGLALPSTTADNHETIEHALNHLASGGSTNGAQGIQLAYQVAQQHFIEGGNNRVILCTDGDFNVGMSDRGQLTRLIEEKAKSGVFLSICGFGMGNYQDGQMEALSNKGNGNYAYIDSFAEAQKVFGKDLTGTLITIAKDVKIQVEFNPTQVQAYRLIGYENRALANQDFNDDTKDAGEIGAGHSVTALYEIIRTGTQSEQSLPSVDALKYQPDPQPSSSGAEIENELLTVKLRYKAPDGDTSKLLSTVVNAQERSDRLSADLQFVSSVAEFGLLLRRSPNVPDASWDALIDRIRKSLASRPDVERSEFLDIVKQARSLYEQSVPVPIE